MSLSRTVSEINAISVEKRNFPTPMYLSPPLKGFRLEFGIGVSLGSKN